jgi:hypothetical protein
MLATSPTIGRDGGVLVPLALEEADRLLAGHQQATSMDIRVTVVVVDEGGHIQAAGRMDGSSRCRSGSPKPRLLVPPFGSGTVIR